MNSSTPQDNLLQLPQFQKSFKIEANGVPIEVSVGHAAPFMIDFDGDGKKDLVVGQYSPGKARVYLNKGTDAAPEFGDFTFLKAGEVDAEVEPSCCIGFDPCFVDLNGDGIQDVTSGQYFGGYINYFEGVGKNPMQFKEGVKIHQPELDDESFKGSLTWAMRTANFVDFDKDGDFDMIWGNVNAEVFYAENTGTPAIPEFAKSVPITADGKPIVVNGKSDPLPVDWDEDGILDLLIGTEAGDILFFKGKQSSGKDFETGISIWTGIKYESGVKVGYKEAKDALDALGDKHPYANRYRVRLGVSDYNNDGKLDLLVGTCYDQGGHKTSGNVHVFLRK